MLINTGNRSFWNDLTQTATNLGMHLDRFGLWRRVGTVTNLESGSSQPRDVWDFVAGKDEKSVFKALKRPFETPLDRNYAVLDPRYRDIPNSRRGKPGRPKKQGNVKAKRAHPLPRNSTENAPQDRTPLMT